MVMLYILRKGQCDIVLSTKLGKEKERRVVGIHSVKGVWFDLPDCSAVTGRECVRL